MTKKAKMESKKIDKVMRNFKIIPFEVVSKRLDEATKLTITRLDNDNRLVSK